MEGKDKAPKHDAALDETTADGKKDKQAREANEKAYNDLLLSCEEEVCFGAVDEAITEDLPDGDAKLAWDNLKARYESTTGASKIQLKKEFSDSRLEDVETDPDEWIADLERIRQRLKTMEAPITDTDFMVHILNNLTVEYENLVESMEVELEDTVNPLTVKILRERLRSKYQGLKRQTTQETDKALVHQFKGWTYQV